MWGRECRQRAGPITKWSTCRAGQSPVGVRGLRALRAEDRQGDSDLLIRVAGTGAGRGPEPERSPRGPGHSPEPRAVHLGGPSGIRPGRPAQRPSSPPVPGPLGALPAPLIPHQAAHPLSTSGSSPAASRPATRMKGDLVSDRPLLPTHGCVTRASGWTCLRALPCAGRGHHHHTPRLLSCSLWSEVLRGSPWAQVTVWTGLLPSTGPF